MTTLDARYRRVAQELERRDTEVKFLDNCTCHCHRTKDAIWLDKGLIDCPIDCDGTFPCSGTVVPSQEVCFWRLTLAMEGCVVQQGDLVWWAYDDWRNNLPNVTAHGTDPLLALLGAVEQSLGISEAV